MTRLGSMVSAAAMLGLVAAAAAQAQTTCVGDCSGKDVVRVNDLILGVDISLNIASLTMCPSFDCNHTGTVTVNCLIQGVNNALIGCPGAPTSTPTTPTATPMVTATPTNTTQPTPTATTSTVERTFDVDTSPITTTGPPYGTCSGAPANTHCQLSSDCPSGQTCSKYPITGLFNSVTGGNAALQFSTGPLVLDLGAPDANGVAPLTLEQDATLSITIITSQCLCLKLLAVGSMGSMYCGSQMGGGPPYDTEVDQSAQMDFAWTYKTGLGPASDPGDGNLLVSTRFKYTTVACSKVDCSDDSVYTDPPNVFPFTTTTASAMKTPTSGPVAMMSAKGQPFSCANFATPGQGILTSGAAAALLGFETADAFRIAEKAQ